MSQSLTLNTGYKIPTIGLGTYKSNPGEVEEAIKYAIDIGYRHFDCAWFYGNENEIGSALKSKICDGTVKRENLFITSKLWNNFHEKKNVEKMLRESLDALQLDYLDLYLIHWPYGFKENAELLPKDGKDSYSDIDYLETWEAMEECYEKGLTKNIGVSNFNKEQLCRLIQNSKIKPSVNQIEVNPNLVQKELIDFCKKSSVVVTAFCPLGRGTQSTTMGYPVSNVSDPNIAKIGEKYGKTPAQVILRYLVNLGVSIIPKSITKSRIKENFELWDFILDCEDMAYMASCNKNIRVSAAKDYADHKYYPF